MNRIIDQPERDDGLIEISIIAQFLLFANVSFNRTKQMFFFFFLNVSFIYLSLFSLQSGKRCIVMTNNVLQAFMAVVFLIFIYFDGKIEKFEKKLLSLLFFILNDYLKYIYICIYNKFVIE